MTVTDPSLGVRPGELIGEKYRVEQLLGQGCMAVVVGAVHLQLGQRVAIKFLRPAALANPEAVARFEREAQAAFRIHSDHVARVMDVGKLSSGAPYMVIEFLEGLDLGKELAKRGMLPVAETVGY
ncbi:MAG: serine/threonine protein kinase, partial [Polyangiaceae bacterium]